MATLNKVTLIGYLGHDPEMRSTSNGESVAHLSVATTETWKDKATGERRQATEWHRVVLYRKLAEIAGQYLKKGSQVYLEGRLQTRRWSGRDDVERFVTEIIADDMRMLGSPPAAGEAEGGDARNRASQHSQQSARQKSVEFEDDAIPF